MLGDPLFSTDSAVSPFYCRKVTLDIIYNLVGSTSDAIIHISVSSELKWYSQNSKLKEISEKATLIRDSISDNFDLRITRALWHKYEYDWGNEDFDLFEEKIKRGKQQVLDELLNLYNDSSSVIMRINAILSTLKKYDLQEQPGYFLYLLGINNVRLSIEICKDLINNPVLPISHYLHSILLGIREKDKLGAINLIKSAIKGGNRDLQKSIATGYGWEAG